MDLFLKIPYTYHVKVKTRIKDLNVDNCFCKIITSKKPTTYNNFRGKDILTDGSRAAATSKMERFVIIINGWKPLTIITKHSILDVAAALDPPLLNHF